MSGRGAGGLTLGGGDRGHFGGFRRVRRYGAAVMPHPPLDLVFVVRAIPSPKDAFWDASHVARLTAERAAPDRLVNLTRSGAAFWGLVWERPEKHDLDRETAELHSRDSLLTSVDALEKRVAAERIRLVAFLGNSLFMAALGSRYAEEHGAEEDLTDAELGGEPRPRRADLSKRTLTSPISFGGARAVALPIATRTTSPTEYLQRFRELAQLRAHLTADADGAASAE